MTEEATPKPEAVQRPRWQRLLGLRRREGRFFKFKPTVWGYVLLGGFFGMIGMGAFAEYSMQPDFCRSCHLMEPYYEAWHQSTHKNVPCTDCHFQPGFVNTLHGKWEASSQAIKYITQTYGSKPHAEVRDVSCMRSGCHEKRVLEGKVAWKVKSVNGHDVTINFDHTPHLNEERRGKQLRCVSCHSQIVQGQHLVVTLDACYLCHFKGFEHGRNDQTMGGCKSCHAAPKEEIRLATGAFKHEDYSGKGVACQNCHSDALKGEGAVNKQVCWTCHNLPSQVARFNEPAFLHEQHVTKRKVECTNCHQQIQHSLTAGAFKTKKHLTGDHLAMEPGQCSSCHESSHSGPADLYRGTGARGVADLPSPMFRAQVDCIACHKTKQESESSAMVKGQTFITLQDSCNYCHQTKYEGTLDIWKDTIKEETNKAEAAYVAAEAAIAKATLDGTALLKAKRLLDDADHNIKLVKLGHGVHNVNYATAALNVATERAEEALKIATGGSP
jgi:nitrate/TMAO reductase-like tetraheme cytochrome c subunit